VSQKKPLRRSPSFQLYCSSFLASCITMTNQQVGAYIRLLCWQWDHDAVPSQEESLRKILGGITKREFRAIWDVLRNKFVEENGLLRNPRLEVERQNQLEYRQKQRERGAAGARARWPRHSDPIALESSTSTKSKQTILTVQPQAIVDLWNNTMTLPIPQVRKLTEKRTVKLRARLREFPDLKTWQQVFAYLNTQDWCRGMSKRGWTANFDWIIESENTMQKWYEKSETPQPTQAVSTITVRPVRPNGRLAKIQASNLALVGDNQ